LRISKTRNNGIDAELISFILFYLPLSDHKIYIEYNWDVMNVKVPLCLKWDADSEYMLILPERWIFVIWLANTKCDPRDRFYWQLAERAIEMRYNKDWYTNRKITNDNPPNGERWEFRTWRMKKYWWNEKVKIDLALIYFISYISRVKLLCWDNLFYTENIPWCMSDTG
jgi:hypothetical protein